MADDDFVGFSAWVSLPPSKQRAIAASLDLLHAGDPRGKGLKDAQRACTYWTLRANQRGMLVQLYEAATNAKTPPPVAQ